MESWNIHEAVEYYKGQDAPQNQFALVELLKEAQEHNSGVLTDCLIEDIAALLNIKVTFLNAVIKRYPSLKRRRLRTGWKSAAVRIVLSMVRRRC